MYSPYHLFSLVDGEPAVNDEAQTGAKSPLSLRAVDVDTEPKVDSVARETPRKCSS